MHVALFASKLAFNLPVASAVTDVHRNRLALASNAQ